MESGSFHSARVRAQPASEFYKDEGGKANCLLLEVSAPAALVAVEIALRIELHYESGERVEERDQNILNIVRDADGVLLHPSESPSATICFRLEKVSRRKDGQRFILCVSPLYAPGAEPSPRLGGVFTHPVCVMSKRKATLPGRLPGAAAAAGGAATALVRAATTGGGDDLAAVSGVLADVATQLAAMRAAIEANNELLRAQAGRIAALEASAGRPSWDDAVCEIASSLGDSDSLSTYALGDSDSLSTYARGARDMRIPRVRRLLDVRLSPRARRYSGCDAGDALFACDEAVTAGGAAGGGTKRGREGPATSSLSKVARVVS